MTSVDRAQEVTKPLLYRLSYVGPVAAQSSLPACTRGLALVRHDVHVTDHAVALMRSADEERREKKRSAMSTVTLPEAAVGDGFALDVEVEDRACVASTIATNRRQRVSRG